MITCTVEEAVGRALFFARYALDGIDQAGPAIDGRRYDPRLPGYLASALAPLIPAVEVARPENDQRTEDSP